MKRVLQTVFCGVAFLAICTACAADSVSDKEMADRYSQAAQSGDSEAQFYVAALYSSGIGRPRSDEEAFGWFSRAASQGHSHAMLVLAGIYALGRGTPKDNLSAYKWAHIVSVGTRVDEFRNGARQLIGVLEARMSREQVNQAKTEAERWHAVPGQAKPAISADDAKRNNPPPQPSLAVSKASLTSPANSFAESSNPQGPSGSIVRKHDVDALLDRVPSGLRKRFGF